MINTTTNFLCTTRIRSLFQKDIPANLASLLRALFYFYLLWFYIDYQIEPFSKIEAVPFWQQNHFLFLFNYLKPPFNLFGAFDIVWKVFIFFSAIGLFSRLSKSIVLIGWCIVGFYDAHFGSITFALTPLISLLIFMVFLDDTAVSIDQKLRKLYLKSAVPAAPILYHSVFFLGLYIIAGIQKIRSTGFEWINGESYLPIIEHFMQVELPGLLKPLMGLMVLVMEFSVPLLLIKKWNLRMTLLFLSFHLFNRIVFQIRSDFWVLSLILLSAVILSEPKTQTKTEQ